MSSSYVSAALRRRVQEREHFELAAGMIRPLTAIGRVTEKLLQLNEFDRVEIRKLLAMLGRYPN